MLDARVTCITKPDRFSAHEHITHLGGANWYCTREDVIASIDARTNTFHVVDAEGHRSEVGVVDPGNGRACYVAPTRTGFGTTTCWPCRSVGSMPHVIPQEEDRGFLLCLKAMSRGMPPA